MLILFAYIWLKAFKKKNWFSFLVKNLLSKSHEYSGSFQFFYFNLPSNGKRMSINALISMGGTMREKFKAIYFMGTCSVFNFPFFPYFLQGLQKVHTGVALQHTF